MTENVTKCKIQANKNKWKASLCSSSDSRLNRVINYTSLPHSIKWPPLSGWQWMSLLVNRGNYALKFLVIEFAKVIILPFNTICRFRGGCNLQKGRTRMKFPPSPNVTHTHTHPASLIQFLISHLLLTLLLLPTRNLRCVNFRYFLTKTLWKHFSHFGWLLYRLHDTTCQDLNIRDRASGNENKSAEASSATELWTQWGISNYTLHTMWSTLKCFFYIHSGVVDNYSNIITTKVEIGIKYNIVSKTKKRKSNIRPSAWK